VIDRIVEIADTALYEIYGNSLPDLLLNGFQMSYKKMHHHDQYDTTIYPLKISYVDPKVISSFTGRSYPWQNIYINFGRISDGNWDIESTWHENTTAGELFMADEFDKTVIHRSFVNHFEDGLAWEETEMFKECLDLLSNGTERSVWKGCTDRDDLLQQCNKFDNLYQNIKDHGYLSQRELSGLGLNRRGPLQQARNEILVDVGRDGELLFVNNRHRLSIAKILDLERVPIAFQVRHKKWVQKRSEMENLEMNHPDIVEYPGSK